MRKGGVAVSIILPSLNVGGYIEECLNSVQKQTLKDIEIICIDAGSTDGTREILAEHAASDERLVIIDSDRKSYGYQVNLGIDKARGEYIGIVDTDDCIDSEMYSELYGLAINTGKPDYVKCNFFSFVIVNGERVSWSDKFIPKRVYERIELDEDRSYAFSANNSIWAGIYKRAFLSDREICFNVTPGAAYQDAGFANLVRLLANSVAYNDKALYYYRLDNGSSSIRNAKNWHAVIDEWNFIEKKLLDTTGNSDPYGVCTGLRIRDYGWNYDRLRGTEFMGMFLEAARHELDQLMENEEEYERLDETERGIIKRIIAHDDSEEYEQRMTDIRELISALDKNNMEYVVIPSGVWCENLVFLQKLLGRRVIRAICDNSEKKIGIEIDEYLIADVKETIDRYYNAPDIRWLIASKKYQKELSQQLLEAGIDYERIFVAKAVPNRYEAVDIIVRDRMKRI